MSTVLQRLTRHPGRTLSRILCCGLMAVPIFAAGDWRRPLVPGAQQARFAETCDYYANRARFQTRGAGAPFVVVLADGCTAAVATLEGGPVADRYRALAFLSRLSDLRQTVIRMNVERVYGEKPHRFAMPQTATGALASFGSVSEAGEYLIAHRMGLVAALEALAETARFSAVRPGAPL